jgi:hypothetical protein
MLACAEFSERTPATPPPGARVDRLPAMADTTLSSARADNSVRPSLMIVRPEHFLRRQAEAFIRTVYGEAFGASGLVFPRVLAALADDDGEPLCAAGLRCAKDGFFSEVYLDASIESVLSLRARSTVARDAIFEVTTLASRSVEASPLFLRQLAILGKAAGFEWSFFTATLRLRRLLAHLGAPPFELASANPARLADAGRWGSYYAHAPKVCALNESWLETAVGASAGAR